MFVCVQMQPSQLLSWSDGIQKRWTGYGKGKGKRDRRKKERKGPNERRRACVLSNCEFLIHCPPRVSVLLHALSGLARRSWALLSLAPRQLSVVSSVWDGKVIVYNKTSFYFLRTKGLKFLDLYCIRNVIYCSTASSRVL